jgi:hypothetical protein
LALSTKQASAVLAHLIDLRLLVHPAAAVRERMRGFLLALRDGVLAALERQGEAPAMLDGFPDRLAILGFLDPDGERYRLALQRARKWMCELGVPVAAERRGMWHAGAWPGWWRRRCPGTRWIGGWSNRRRRWCWD